MSEIYYDLFHMTPVLHTARISNGDSVMFNKRDDRFFELDKEIEKDVLFVLSRAWDTYSIYKEYFYYQFNIV